MHIIGKAVQGDNFGEDCGMAEPEVQAQYFEWESYADADLKIASVQYPSVQGRLRKNVDFWLNEFEPSTFVAEIVSVGYRLPFMRLPWDPRCQPNHKSVLENAAFVDDAIQELVT